MKIGILTFYRNANYGAMLQALGLFRFLRSIGHEPVFLRTPIQRMHQRGFWRTCGRCLLSVASGHPKQATRFFRAFLTAKAVAPLERFAGIFPVSPPLGTAARARRYCRPLGAVIVGSDQLWNPHWVLSRLSLVFLDFVPPGCRRIAYAPSFSVPEWPEEGRGEVGRLLKRFHAISVRESSGEEIVRTLCPGADVETVLDPTLLVGSDFWRSQVSVRPPGGRAPFLFSYFLPWTRRGDVRKWKETLAALWPEVAVLDDSAPPPGGAIGWLCGRNGIRGKVPVPVWLDRIANADFVLTNSFHGTAFALLFHRPFATVLLSGSKTTADMNERIESLLEKAGLPDRMVPAGSFDALGRVRDRPLDWDSVDARLSAERDRSKRFLLRALSEPAT